MSSIVSDKNTTTEIVSGIQKVLDPKSPVLAMRQDAISHLRTLGLPGNRSEEYKHTPITRVLEKNFNFALPNAPTTHVDTKKVLIPGVDGYVIYMINGKYSAESTVFNLPKGVTIMPLSEAVYARHSEVIERLGKIAEYSTDPFAAWNTAAWTDGVFINIAPNTILEKPVIIYHIHDTNAGQIVSATRNLVVAGRGSEVTVVEKFDTTGKSNGFSSHVVEAMVDENAGLKWYSIQNDSGNRFQFDYKQFQQASSSRVNCYTFTLDGKLVRNNLNLSLDGQGIDSHMFGLYLIGKDMIADNHTVVDHRQPNSFSNELYKGIIEDSAKGVFNGKIYVRPNAQKTNAFQANRNILLTDKATINTKPQLEIWADDVKCSHGCTSGQLDEEAMFYLQARGISKDTARAMMLYAFAGELLETMKDDSLKTYIDSLLSERLHKNF